MNKGTAMFGNNEKDQQWRREGKNFIAYSINVPKWI